MTSFVPFQGCVFSREFVGLASFKHIYWAIELTSFIEPLSLPPPRGWSLTWRVQREQRSRCVTRWAPKTNLRESFEKLPNNFFGGEQKHNQELVFSDLTKNPHHHTTIPSIYGPFTYLQHTKIQHEPVSLDLPIPCRPQESTYKMGLTYTHYRDDFFTPVKPMYL